LVIPRHFIPPLIVNTFLGAVLWESYSFSSDYLEKRIPDHPILMAASSGAFAGACQSLMAAPAENVRIVLEAATNLGQAAQPVDTTEGNTSKTKGKGKAKAKASAIDPVKEILSKPTTVQSHHAGWGHAWKRVFQGDEPLARASTRDEVRQLQRWAQEIKGMAGRGWDGWAWGCGKDMFGEHSHG
jgi:hypothetical protein